MSNSYNIMAREYSTVYAFTSTTLFTTTITVSSNQASATLNYPQPAITQPLSSVTYVLPTPNTYNTLFPPQTEVLLPVLVRTDIVGIVEKSGVPFATHTLVQGLLSVTNLVFDVSDDSQDGTSTRGCVGLNCWSNAERIGLIVGICALVVLVLITCVWGVFYRLGYRKVVHRDKKTGKNIYKVGRTPPRYLVTPPTRVIKKRITTRFTEDTSDDQIAADDLGFGGIQMRDFSGVIRPTTAHFSTPTIHIVSPNTPIITIVSSSPGQPSRREHDRSAEDPDRLSASYQPRHHNHRHRSRRHPAGEGYVNIPDATSSTDAVVGHGMSSEDDSYDHAEPHDTQYMMGYARTISDASTIVEEVPNHDSRPSHPNADADEHGNTSARGFARSKYENAAHEFTDPLKSTVREHSHDSEQQTQSKAAKLARKAGKKIVPAVEEEATHKVQDYLMNLENDKNVSKTAKIASKAAQKLVSTVTEQLDRQLDAHSESTGGRRKKRHHRRDSGSERHHRRSTDRHGRRSHDRKHKKSRKHRDTKQKIKKVSKLAVVLPLLFGIIHELWEPKGIWAHLIPKPHGDTSESSDEGAGGGYVATAENTPEATYTAPNETPQTPTSGPDQTNTQLPRTNSRAHHRRRSSPDSYIAEAPKPVKVRPYKASKPTKYTFTGEKITPPGVAINNGESSAMGAERGAAAPSRSPDQDVVDQSEEVISPEETNVADEDRNERRRSRRHASRR